MLKKIFGRKGNKKKDEEGERELTIEDLVTLERYDEAAEKLQARVKMFPKDLHAHLKLAEVYVSLKTVNKALDEFSFVADSYADDGFFEKAVALLSKASRLAPGDDMLPRRIERYRRLKRLEHRRRLAIEGLMANKTAELGSKGNSALELELLWNKIVKSHLVEQLDGEQLKRLFSVMEMIKTKDGQLLADPSRQDSVMYLVVDGVVEATAEVNGKQMNVRSFSTGDLIGDSVLLERKRWPARYSVGQSGTLLRLTRDAMQQAMAGDSDPLGFISVLRQQQNDRDVAVSLQKLSAGG